MNTRNFRTKQEFSTDTNPKGKDFIIGLDIGYSGTKVFYELGHFCFPSYAKKINSELIEEDADDILYRDDQTGDIYMVGINAQKMVESTDTNDTEGELYSRRRYTSRIFKVICNTALALALRDKNDTRKIVVQTGLPSSYTAGDSPALIKALCRPAKFSLKKGGENWRRYNIQLEKDNIFVIAQPAGALYSVMIRPDGNYVPDANRYLRGNTLVLDIGSGTCDFIGLKNRSIVCSESINNIGMREVLTHTAKKILNETGEDIKITALQNNLWSGKVAYLDEENLKSGEKSIAPFLEEANREVMEEAVSRAREITDSFRGYETLIIDGGTGEAWYDAISRKLEGMKTLRVIPCNINDHLPFIYANARGYYMYCYVSHKKTK